MLAGLFDHLWQSTWACGCLAALAFAARHCFAALRLWLWRIAAIKFVVPFALLFAIGRCMGFPVAHTADPAPPELIVAAAALTPLASPARLHRWSDAEVWSALTVALMFTGACVLLLKRHLGVERQRVAEEAARREIDIDATAPRPGFFLSAFLTACAISCVAVPVLAGAVDDRQRHLERLASNSLALRYATMKLTEAKPGSASRYRIDVDAHGVTVRNVNIRRLVAIVYGISYYAVNNNQVNWQPDAEIHSWFFAPLYDLRATATLPAPEDFDPYALRQGVTRLLGERFGLQLELDGACQPPCGSYGVPLSDDPL
jgi:hypothetical protein